MLTAEQRTSQGKEPDGSAASLWGNMAGRMGDRVERTRPEGLQERKPKKRATGDEGELPRKRKVSCTTAQHSSPPRPGCGA